MGDLEALAIAAAEAAVVGERVWRIRSVTGVKEWGTVVGIGLKYEDGDSGFLVDVRWDDGFLSLSLDEDYAFGDRRPVYGPPTEQQRHDVSDMLMASFLLETQLVGKLTAKPWSPGSLAHLEWVEDRLGNGGDPAGGEGPGGP